MSQEKTEQEQEQEQEQRQERAPSQKREESKKEKEEGEGEEEKKILQSEELSEKKRDYDSVIEDADSQLEMVTKILREQLDIKDRKWYLTTYKKCFIGSEAVTLMVKSGISKTREQAVDLGNLMLAADIFRHVTKDHNFKDDNLFYRFVSDEESHGAKEKNQETSQDWSWGDLVPGLFRSEQKINLQAKVEDLSSEVNDAKIDQKDTFGVWPIDVYNQELLDNVHPVKWISPKPQRKYNIVAIGAGAGGLVSAAGAAGLGGKSAIIEEHLFGGDCLNSGCVPSKALLKSAKVALYAIRRAEEFGLKVEGSVTVDFPKVMERMRKIRAEISHHDACERFTKVYGMDVYLGHAQFISENKIKVGDNILEFARAVIATGGKPSVPPIPGVNEVEYLTNHSIWNLTELPKRFAVLGAGPVGCEMAQAFALFGSQVTVFNRTDRILGKEDLEAGDVIKKSMESCGVRFVTGISYKSIKYVDPTKGKSSGISIVIESKKDATQEEIIVDELLIATGRKPNVENLGLENAGVKYDLRKGVIVNDYLQTSNSDIYAVGDCCTRYQFTHMADAMARMVIRNALFFGRAKCSDLVIPWCTYTFPEIAHVGLYESDLKTRRIEYDVVKVDLEHNDRAICEHETEGFVKVLIKKGSDQILGCTIVSENAGDQINEVTLAIQTNTGLGFFAGVIHPYPTIGEAVKAAGDAFNRTRLTPVTKALLRRILSARR